MIFVDEHSGLRLSGYQYQIKKEFAYLIQRLIRENVISLDELYELNEKALTSEESILPNLSNKYTEKASADNTVEIIKAMDKQLCSLIGCKPFFESDEEIQEFLKKGKEDGNSDWNTGADGEGLSDSYGLHD